MTPSEVSALYQLLARSGMWTPRHNPLLDLAAADRKILLGYTPRGHEPSLVDRERRAHKNLRSPFPLYPAGVGAPVSTLPESVDWRAKNGKNYISAVKFQGSCGSCVAFGTSAAIDAQMRIEFGGPIGTATGYQLQDVSEAQLYYCSTSAGDAHDCTSGWYVEPALSYAKNPGLVPENCFPYTAGDQPCALCNNWQALVTQVGGTKVLQGDIQDMKSWLAAKGPLVACFSVYEDFFHYSSGVYTYVSGKFQGGHCICVIGYDETLGAWLCKNSWAASWGMGGYFWIAYGQVGIDDTMWGIHDFSKIYHT